MIRRLPAHLIVWVALVCRRLVTCVLVFTFFFELSVRESTAQNPGVSRVEAGPVFGIGKASRFGEYFGSVGGRVTFNPSTHLGVEADISHFSVSDQFLFSNPYEIHADFNAKPTYRSAGLSVFGLAGPGLVSTPDYAPGTDCAPRPAGACVRLIHELHGGFNFGGGVELFPAKRVGLRSDITDVILSRSAGYRHRTKASVGIVFRFFKRSPGG
jgi:hypothetical protein